MWCKLNSSNKQCDWSQRGTDQAEHTWWEGRSTPCSWENTDVAASFKYLAQGGAIPSMFPELATIIFCEWGVSLLREIACCLQSLICMVLVYTNILQWMSSKSSFVFRGKVGAALYIRLRHCFDQRKNSGDLQTTYQSCSGRAALFPIKQTWVKTVGNQKKRKVPLPDGALFGR